jgi:membrane associated rhomboid family serine protease
LGRLTNMNIIKRKASFAIFVSSLLVTIVGFFFLLHESNLFINKQQLAVQPGNWNQIHGVVTMILAHADAKHLFFNLIPLLVLTFMIVFFYLRVSLQVLVFMIIFSGMGVFLVGNPGYHMGASGLVFGQIAFLIASGFIRQNRSLLVISFLVVFLYGSSLWGVLPIKEGVSWEGHLSGAIGGVIAAFIWKNKGPGQDLFLYQTFKHAEEDEYKIFSVK